MGRLKPIIKVFDSGWNSTQHIMNKLISLIVIWSWKFGSIARNKITSLWALVNRVCNTAYNLLPEWIFKPRLQRHKNQGKTSHGAGKFSQNLYASKKLWYNESNCKLGRHSQRHTFMN